jgi:glycosyltransferase involved in cell wall biosynthesis
MRVSVIAPVRNEEPWIGYSVLAALPGIHDFVYAVDPTSDDGTIEILRDLQKELGEDKIKLLLDKEFAFNPLDMQAYNHSFNACLEKMTGEAAFFLHPDMVVHNPEALLSLDPSSTAWWTNITSYAGDFNTVITKGRGSRWKNIHLNVHGLHYYGGYGSKNEDFYYSDITGDAHDFHGSNFSRYPFQVSDSHVKISHYCELKSYKRRYEKMKLCMTTQYAGATALAIEEMAVHHPRVHLQPGSSKYGEFKFEKTNDPVPEVILKYRDRFEAYTKDAVPA